MSDLPPTATADPHFPTPPEWTGRRILDRYLIGEAVGSGGFGVVYRATDELDQRTVAVKVLHQLAPSAFRRLEREIAALGHCHLPGVVNLLDSGVVDGIPFYVMNFIEGTPFPGTPDAMEWSALEGVLIALLESLSRVHQLGIVHRDLKPQNVLVDARGVPTLLDFGLAWGPILGPRMTQAGRFVGSPAYFAPEQLGGKIIDVRADLYSIGVMIFQALTGTLPFVGMSLEEIALEKSRGCPSPLHHLNSEIPRRISDLVTRLLDPNPLARPDHAASVLEIIRGESRARHDLPWIDHCGLEDRLVRAEKEQRGFRIVGAAGMGRSRAIDEAARLLDASGWTIDRTVPAESPFASLETVLESGEPEEIGLRLPEKAKRVAAQLREKLADRHALLVDDIEKIDRWSREVIESATSAGLVIEAKAPPADNGDLSLAPFEQIALEGFFHGPQRVFHLPEDAAEQLYNRTDGIPDLVAEELAAWERAGVCVREEERWRITREAIDQLAAGFETASHLRISKRRTALTLEQEELLAWVEMSFPHATLESLSEWLARESWWVEAKLTELEELSLVTKSERGWRSQLTGLPVQIWTEAERRHIHAMIAEKIPTGDGNGIYHLIEAGTGSREWSETNAARVVAEILATAEKRIADEQYGEAIALLANGLNYVRSAQLPDAIISILEAWAPAAYAGGIRALLRILGEVQRSDDGSERYQRVRRYCEAWLQAHRGGGLENIRELQSLAETDDLDFALKTQTAQVLASRSLTLEEERSVLRKIEESVTPETDQWHSERLPIWTARYLYRVGEFEESARLLHSVIPLVNRKMSRATIGINAAYAELDAFLLPEALETATSALHELQDVRAPLLELRCLSILRKVTYRLGQSIEVDEELIRVCDEIPDPSTTASTLLNEGAIAWRQGQLETAIPAVQRAATLWKQALRSDPEILAELFLRFLGADSGRDPASLLEASLSMQIPGLQAQAFGFLAMTGTRVPTEALQNCIESIPRQSPYRREILSISEVRSAFQDSTRGRGYR